MRFLRVHVCVSNRYVGGGGLIYNYAYTVMNRTCHP